jgi:hypothetical protein
MLWRVRFGSNAGRAVDRRRIFQEVVMNHLIELAGLFGLSLSVASGGAGAQTPIACALLSEKEALALVGGPLGEIEKGESKPTPRNDHTHGSWCNFYPKGYAKASGPLERGLTLQLQAMRNNADAKNTTRARCA